MKDNFNVEFEITISRDKDLFVAKCRSYPEAVGQGETEELAISALAESIIKQTEERMNAVLQVLAKHASPAQEWQAAKNKPERMTRKVFTIKMPPVASPEPETSGPFKLDDFIMGQAGGPVPTPDILQDEKIRRKIMELIDQLPPPHNTPGPFEQMVIVGMPFSKN